MDLKNLSSNWKKLKQQLDKTKELTSAKRKPSEERSPLPQPKGKRRRLSKKTAAPALNGITRSKTSKMGLTASKAAGVTAAEPASKISADALPDWAEEHDISAKDLAAAYGPRSSSMPDLKSFSDKINGGRCNNVGAGRYIAIDCEMVGVGPNPDEESALARVSIVNYDCEQLYDSFVLPKEPVTDYRSFVSGITSDLLKEARTLEEVQKDVAELMQGRILVGHAVRHDLDALLLGHPRMDIRDTSRHKGYRKLSAGRTPALRKLAKEVLGYDIQSGEHSSIEDARVAMLLFRKEKAAFEQEHARRFGVRNSKPNGGSNKITQANDSGEKKKREKKKKKTKKKNKR
jgi:RNA exonuclease 4